MRSISDGLMHVVEDGDGRLIAAFAGHTEADKNYERGIDGAWMRDGSPMRFCAGPASNATRAAAAWACS